MSLMFEVVMLSVFLFVVVFAFVCGFVAGGDDVRLRDAVIEEVVDVNVCDDCVDDTNSVAGSEVWVESNPYLAVSTQVPTFEDRIVYIMPNAIELLTEEFNDLPHRVMPNRYGWDVTA